RDAFGQVQPLTQRGMVSKPIQALSFAHDGTAVLIGGEFAWYGLRREGDDWHVLCPQASAPVTSMALLDGTMLAVRIGDVALPTAGAFELWDLTTGQKRKPEFFEPNGVRAVAACATKRVVAWATGHRKVCAWEIIRQRPIDFALQKNCNSIALNPDGT